MNNSTIECALSYAERGWSVIPLHAIENGKCTCRRQCKSPGKHPIFSKWQDKASIDPVTIKQFWNKYPYANIVIVTGQQTGLVIVDIDPRNGGDASLQALIDSYSGFKSILNTYTVQTGGNGSHFYYLFNKPFKSYKKHGLGIGIDIKADGGYILAPPSNHLSGGAYSVQNNVEPLVLPPMLINLITAGQIERSINQTKIVEGSRNDTLMQLAAEQFRQGKTLEQVKALLFEENALHCKPPLESIEVVSIVKSLASSFKPEATQTSFKTRWQQAVLESGEGSGFAHVLMALSLFMDVEGRNCYPTEETLSERIRISRKTIRGHLCKAVDAGFLKRYPRGEEGKRGFSYGYIAMMPTNQDG